MQEELMNELEVAYILFALELKDGKGFDEGKYLNLCNVLKRYKKEWMRLELLPRQTVFLLIDIVGLYYYYDYSIYSDEERKRIKEALTQIHLLICDIVCT